MRTATASAVLVALLAAAPATTAGNEVDLNPLVHAAQAGATTLAAGASRAVDTTLGAAGGSTGPLLASVDQLAGLGDGALPLVAAVLAPAARAQGAFLGLGEGDVAMELRTSGTNGSCAEAKAIIEWHPPASNEGNFYYDFSGGKGTPSLVCGLGWRGTLRPHEVQGSPEQGWVGHTAMIDAIVDITVSPLRPDGTRAVWARQVTYPDGLADMFEFRGTVRDLA
jgi:hypothetical protein